MNPTEMIRYLAVLALLLPEALIDIRKHEINVIIPGGFAILGVVLTIIVRDIPYISVTVGIVEGLLIILISYLTKEQIGHGDGIIIAATGTLLGWKSNLIMFFSACFMSAIVAVILMIIKKADKKSRIPFVPFLIPGFLISVLLAVI